MAEEGKQQSVDWMWYYQLIHTTSAVADVQRDLARGRVARLTCLQQKRSLWMHQVGDQLEYAIVDASCEQRPVFTHTMPCAGREDLERVIQELFTSDEGDVEEHQELLGHDH